jgi:hypothetical protein
MGVPSVYFIQVVGGGPVKIGHSVDPEHRLQGLMCWCPYELEILATAPGCPLSEAAIHRELESSRSRGEWFHPTPEVMAFVDEVKKAGALPKRIPNTLDEALNGVRKNTTRMREVLAQNGMTVKELAAGMGIPFGTAAHFTSSLTAHRAVQIAEYLTSIGIPTKPRDLYGDRATRAVVHAPA